MEVGESIDISDLPGRIVHCSVRCRRNVKKYTGSFKFTNVNHREDVFYCFPGSGEGDDGILKRQSLLTVREYSHGYQRRFIFDYEKVKT